jgi:benzil reductase ((S)-benzoin forming)
LRTAIITGVSRGLGRALLELARARYDAVVAIGRRMDHVASGPRLSFMAADLADNDTDWDLAFANEPLVADAREIVFFDNAGVLALAATGGEAFRAALSDCFAVNVAAPAAIAGALSRHGAKLTIVHVSTGAARRPIAGWGAYCASKAAAAMIYDVLALERADIVVHKIDPGVLDTDMQAKIRGANSALVTARDQFRALFDQGRLISPADAATSIFAAIGV